MTRLDDTMLPLALAKVDEFGVNATFETVTRTYSPATGTTTESGAADVVRKITPPEPFVKEFESDSATVVADLKTYVAASGLAFTPSNGQDVTFGGIRWQIVRVLPIYSGASIALYELLLKG